MLLQLTLTPLDYLSLGVSWLQGCSWAEGVLNANHRCMSRLTYHNEEEEEDDDDDDDDMNVRTTLLIWIDNLCQTASTSPRK